MDSASSSTAAGGSSPMPPPLVELPRLELGFGNPSPCTAENTSLEDMLAQLLHVAHNDSHTRVQKLANRLVDKAGMSIPEAVAMVQAPWSKGHGPLHMAAAAGKVKSCRILIDDFGLHVDGTDTDGATPLVFAIYGNGSAEVVTVLLESGADPNREYCNGVAPLHVATIRGTYEIAKLLLSKGANVNALWEHKTPLSIAAQHGNAMMMELLLQNNANPNMYAIPTPLKAAIIGRSKIAVELLIKAGAHVNVGMPENPLIAAATAGLTEIVKCLLKAGADANIIDYIGRTPVEKAAIQGWRECVEVLFPVTNCLARIADWSIDGVIQHAKDLPREDDFVAEGDAAFSKKDYAHALNLYTMAMEIVPDDLTLYARRSLCFLYGGDEGRALEDSKFYLRILLKDFNKDKGDAAFCERDYAPALAFYNMAMEIDPSDSTLYAKRSLCFLHMGDEINAAKNANMYRDMEPDLSACYAQGGALVLVMEFGKAEGDAAFCKWDCYRALTLYTMAIEIDPDDSTLYARRSLCFLRTGNRVKALEDAKTFKYMQPDLSELLLLKRAALVLVKEFGRACEALNFG